MKIYFCTDHRSANGCSCPDKLGYKNSWLWDSEVEIFSINGRKLPVKYTTPYMLTLVEEGKTYSSDFTKNYMGEIEHGLHSYKERNAAKRACSGQQETVAECVIPKGATYYTGWFGGSVSYASDTLKYVKIDKK